jgi:peptide/nickel transport system substrate-binding protein
MTLGMIADIQRLDPHRQTGNPTNQVLSLITESLLEMDENGVISPGLAESWEASGDSKEWTFKMRRGVMFHNGREMVADDVKKSYDHIRDPKTQSPKRGNFDLIDRIEVVDRYTVKFYLKEPAAGFGAEYFGGNAPIIPPETFDTNRPVGTGPFEFVEWKPRQYLKAKRFKNYWRKGRPYLDEIIFRPITDDTVRYTGLRTGDIDFDFSLDFAELPKLLKKPPEGVVLSVKGGSRWFYVNLQTQRGPLKDVRVRQAIAYAINKKDIMNGLTWGLARPEAQPYPSTSEWYMADVKDRETDLPQAKKLLEEAGYGKGLQLVTIVRNETPIMNLVTLLQAQLKQVGIDLSLEVMDRATHQRRQTKHDFDVNPGHLGFYADPDAIYARYNSTGEPNNYGGYSNPDFDKLMEEGRRTANKPKRKEIYRKALLILNRDLPFVFLGHLPVAQGWRSNIKGFKTNIRGDIAFHGGGVAHAWIEK